MTSRVSNVFIRPVQITGDETANASTPGAPMLNQKLALDEFNHIKNFGVVSIFWITDTNARARRIARLQKIGAIIRHQDDQRDNFPYCVFSVDETRLTLFTRHATKKPPSSAAF